jgi:hypothetical protein
MTATLLSLPTKSVACLPFSTNFEVIDLTRPRTYASVNTTPLIFTVVSSTIPAISRRQITKSLWREFVRCSDSFVFLSLVSSKLISLQRETIDNIQSEFAQFNFCHHCASQSLHNHNSSVSLV